MKRAKLLALLPSLLLSSCNGLNPVGTYQFRLGKTDQNHLEVTARITDEVHEKHASEGMKMVYLSADLGEEMSPISIIDSYAEKYPIIESFVDIIKDAIANIKEIPMYYKVLNSSADKGRRLAVGTDILVDLVDSLKEKYPDIIDLIESLGVGEDEFDITPDRSQYIFNAYLSKKTLTFQIPVSMDDLDMQLFWLGENPMITGDYLDRLPGPKGEDRFGSHPAFKKNDRGEIIYNEVDVVNKEFEKEFSKTYFYDSDGLRIGSFVSYVEEDKTNLKLYLNDTYQGSRSNIEGYVYTKGLLGEFDVKKDMKISVDENGLTDIVNNGKEGKEEGFSDENGKEFRFIDLMQKPFVFRDYHIVNIGLTKI